MVDVNEIIRLTEERSNDIDIVATIKNSFENFYTEDLGYAFVKTSNSSMPMGNLEWEIEKHNPKYEFKEIDELFIDAVYNQLEKGFFISMATVKIDNDICRIKSTKTYEYSPEDLGFSSFSDLNVYTWERENVQILGEDEYDCMFLDSDGSRIHVSKYFNNIYGILVTKENGEIKIRYCGDSISGFRPLFYTFDFINDEDQVDYQFNTINPIVQKVVKAIYNGIIFK